MYHALAALHREGGLEVVRPKDRFSSPSDGGWRDLMVNIVVLDGGAGGAAMRVLPVALAAAILEHRQDS